MAASVPAPETEQTDTEKHSRPKKRKHIVREYLESFGTAILVVFVVHSFIIKPFKIPTSSMEDTLLVGDHLMVNMFVYGARVPLLDWRLPAVREPEQGDVFVFKYPLDPSIDYVKRCVAVSGQTVEVRNRKVYVDGQEYPLPSTGKFIDPRTKHPSMQERDIFPAAGGNRDFFGPITVPEDHYFALGDNRDNSLDSRYWGFVPKENLVGVAMFIYFSWDKEVPLYRMFHKIRWDRLGQLIH
jgi:signal peptidase I